MTAAARLLPAVRRPSRILDGGGERLLTTADLAALPDELPSGPVRYELDDGRLLIMAPPGDEHGAQESKIVTALVVQAEYRGFGKVRCGESAVVLRRDPDRVVGADALFVANTSLPIRRSPEGYLETIPDLVVEIRSRSDRAGKLQSKVNDYLAAGVRLVWVVDPTDRTVIAHRPGVGATVHAQTDTLVCEDIIPGFRLLVADVFRD